MTFQTKKKDHSYSFKIKNNTFHILMESLQWEFSYESTLISIIENTRRPFPQKRPVHEI